MNVPPPPVPDWTITRLENLALIEAAFTRDSESVKAILGNGFGPADLARAADAIALATQVISCLADPAVAIAALRQMAIDGDLDGEIDR